MNVSQNKSTREPLKHHADKRFLEYYRDKSSDTENVARSSAMYSAITSFLARQGQRSRGLSVADIGCGPGAQAILWASKGFSVKALDVNADFIAAGQESAKKLGLEIDFRIGSATDLPWDDESVDICLAPELLEHVPNWDACLDEFARILRPGGLLFINTSNKLCPIQSEFNLPLYSWYPSSLKRYCERLATTTRPDLVNFATYPAVNWFSFYSLRNEFAKRGLVSFDRMDVSDIGRMSDAKRRIIGMMRRSSLLRLVVHLLTPSTQILGIKNMQSKV